MKTIATIIAIIVFTGLWMYLFLKCSHKPERDVDVRYEMVEHRPYTYTLASYYSYPFHGRQTANQEIYDKNAYTAASCFLPFNTFLVVNNPRNGKSVVVRINDRGPFAVCSQGSAVFPLRPHPTRGLDLSQRAFESIADIKEGVIEVRYTVINPF